MRYLLLFLMFVPSFGESISLDLSSDIRSIETWLEENRGVAHDIEILRAERLLEHKLNALPSCYDSLPKPSIPRFSGIGLSREDYLHELDNLQESLNQARRSVMVHPKCLRILKSLASDCEVKSDVMGARDSGSCPVCLTEIEAGENIVRESCGHIYHSDCLHNAIHASVRAGDDRFLSCVSEACSGSIEIENLASLCLGDSAVIRFFLQKLILSRFEKVAFCPSCGLGLKRADRASEGICNHCYKEICFDCGYGSHFGEKCDVRLDKLETYQEVLKRGLNVGLCPYCDCLMERTDGCPTMRCGDHAHTSSDVSNRGCGREFQWPDRKPVPEKLKDIPKRSKQEIQVHFPKINEEGLKVRVLASESLFDIEDAVKVSSVEEALNVIRLGGRINFRFLFSDVSQLDADLLVKYGGTSFEGSRESSYWDYTYKEDGFTYYVITLNDYDFDFVEVPGKVRGPFGIFGRKPGYFMMSTAVTQGHWFAVMGENPSYFKGRGLDLPMESVSYEDIVGRFLRKLNTLLKKAGFEGELKLPTNSQWQRMANKNVASDFGMNKSEYSDFEKRWIGGQPAPVKSKAVGRLGARMFGGVWEWVGSPDASGHVAMRGGSWLNNSVNVGPSASSSDRSGGRRRYVGFRLLRTFPGQA